LDFLEVLMMFRISFDNNDGRHHFEVEDTATAMHLVRTLYMNESRVRFVYFNPVTSKWKAIHFDSYNTWGKFPEYHFDGEGFIDSSGAIRSLIKQPY
jgi:hypothetical protein